MQALFGILRPLIFLHAIVAVALVFLCRTLARRFPEERFLRYWAWAWAAYAGYLIFGGIMLELNQLHLLPSAAEAFYFLAALSGYGHASLLILGANSAREAGAEERRRGAWSIAVVAALAAASFLLTIRSRDALTIRVAARQAVVGLTFLYCAAAFKHRARHRGSRSALAIATACAAYGVVYLLLAAATWVSVQPPRLQPMLFLIYVDLVCKFVIAAAMLLQLDEEYQLQQRRLGESEDRFLVLFESNPVPMFVYDPGTLRFLAVNEASISQYGYSRDELLAMSCLDLSAEPDRVAASSALAGQLRGPFGAMGTWQHRKKDGSLSHADIITEETRFRGQPARMAVAVDVSQRARLEEQLRHAQKMEAVGQLAGGVAHDFNNLLTLIQGHVDALRTGPELTSPQEENLTEISQTADQAAALARQLLAFSRKQVLQPKVLQLDSVVSEIAPMLQRLLGEHIELAIRTDPGPDRVMADRSQVEQVLMNLAVNARDAMPSGGRLSVRTANVEVGSVPPPLFGDTPIPSGRYVLLHVSDTGSGMDPATRSRIFEPFFSTKEPARGTGLGLATVYGIVKQSGGWIGVESEPGRGASFKVFLPRVDAALETSAVQDRMVSPSPPLNGRETILLVEDEEGIRNLAGSFLTGNGYTVLAAGDGIEALDLAQHHAQTVDLLVTDMVMPKLNGRELVRQLVRSTPRMRILYISGYSNQEQGLEETASYLAKPFSMEQLARKVREVLDRPTSVKN
ncbi:MAG TPA: ATP-binding protein [Myxococcaceae bacterium]|nr:ATP-binding protein [Myxococcaceae bacterium]